jgi:hypothetical protein
MQDAPRPGRYAKPLVVADRLNVLSGQTSGVVALPRHLDWSGNAIYDLDSPGRIVDLYRTVLIEATKPADLHTYLDEAALRRLWSYLWLPADLRAPGSARRRLSALRLPRGRRHARQ